MGALLEFSCLHALEKFEVLHDRPVSVRALPARFGECSPVLPNLIRGQAAHISLLHFDELDSVPVELIEVVRCIVQPVLPVKAEPSDVGFDRLHILDIFLGRVGVVKAEVAFSSLDLGGDPEIQADRLRVPDVQVAVGLRGKSRHDATVVLVCLQIRADDCADEVFGLQRSEPRFECGPFLDSPSVVFSIWHFHRNRLPIEDFGLRTSD